MKCCPYCGQEYPDEVDVCTIDGQPLEDPAKLPGMPQDLPLPARPSFDARLVSHGVSSGVYRIHLRGSDLLFIQIEVGEITRNWHAITAFLGPVGSLVYLLFRSYSRRRANAALAHTTDRDAEELIHENADNFRLYIPEIRDAVMEPSTWFALTGKQVGRLSLFVRDGKEVHLEFTAADEMRTALCLLGPVLNSTLRVNVEWNVKEQRFQRRKPDKGIDRATLSRLR
jgi:hypothetical protein